MIECGCFVFVFAIQSERLLGSIERSMASNPSHSARLRVAVVCVLCVSAGGQDEYDNDDGGQEGAPV